jgi:hypothetical protein
MTKHYRARPIHYTGDAFKADVDKLSDAVSTSTSRDLCEDRDITMGGAAVRNSADYLRQALEFMKAGDLTAYSAALRCAAEAATRGWHVSRGTTYDRAGQA